MTKDKTDASKAIFRSIKDDGTCWLFVTLPDRRWVITCDGQTTAAGTAGDASIAAGIRKYLSFIASTEPVNQVQYA